MAGVRRLSREELSRRWANILKLEEVYALFVTDPNMFYLAQVRICSVHFCAYVCTTVPRLHACEAQLHFPRLSRAEMTQLLGIEEVHSVKSDGKTHH